MYRHILTITGLCCVLLACGSTTPPEELAKLPQPLNDTGTSFCRDLNGANIDCTEAPPQDGSSGRDSAPGQKRGGGYAGFDFTKLDTTGKPLARQDVSWSGDDPWACVKDNHTELVWETKSTAPDSLNHRDHLYVWHNPALPNGGLAGEPAANQCGGVACDTQSFVEAMNKARWCGFSNWRLPTTSELLSLVITDHLALVTDRDYFPETQSSHYWTGQTYAPDNNKAWYVYFSDGSVASTLKSQRMYIRLVANP